MQDVLEKVTRAVFHPHVSTSDCLYPSICPPPFLHISIQPHLMSHVSRSGPPLLVTERACLPFLLGLSYPEMAAQRAETTRTEIPVVPPPFFAESAEDGSHRSLLQQTFPSQIGRETSPAPGETVKNCIQHSFSFIRKGWKLQRGRMLTAQENYCPSAVLANPNIHEA